MRNMDYIGISQSIGRVIRLKALRRLLVLFVSLPMILLVSVPLKVQAVVDVVFNQGQPAIMKFVDNVVNIRKD